MNSQGIMNIQEIMGLLPHRFPFLLIDRVLEFKSEQYLVALKNVSINEPFFTGHFPTKAVMPGVLIVEALAQAAGILAYQSSSLNREESIFYLGSIENARFRKVVVPGDQLQLRVETERRRGHIWKFKGIATVGEDVVCTATMTSAEGKVNP